jgi:hypothetical protein
MDEVKLIEEFTAGLKHQAQFQDRQRLNALQRAGATFLWLAKACMDKGKGMNSTRSPTWEKSTSTVDRSGFNKFCDGVEIDYITCSEDCR